MSFVRGFTTNLPDSTHTSKQPDNTHTTNLPDSTWTSKIAGTYTAAVDDGLLDETGADLLDEAGDRLLLEA